MAILSPPLRRRVSAGSIAVATIAAWVTSTAAVVVAQETAGVVRPDYPARLVQPGDDPPVRLDPVVPRDPQTDARLEALSLFMQGQVHEKRRELIEAYDSYRRAIERDDSSYAIYQSYVPLAYVLGDSDRAIASARRTAAIHDDGHDLLRALAAIMRSTGRTDDAATLLVESLNVPRIRDRRLPTLLVRRDLGQTWASIGKYEEAAQQFRLVFDALEPPQPSTVDSNGDSERDVATEDDAKTAEDGSAKDTSAAAASLSPAEREVLLGEAGETYELIGTTFLAAELPDLAVAAFNRASELQDSRPAVHSYNLATVFEKQGEFEKALASLDEYLAEQLRSKGVAAYELLESLYRQLDRESELLARLGELVEADRLNRTLRFFYAGKLLDAARLDDAREQYSRGLGGGSDPRGLVGLLAIARRQADAEQTLKNLIKLYPKLPQVRDESQLANADDDVRRVILRYRDELSALTGDADLLTAVTKLGEQRIADDDFGLVETLVLAKVLIDAGRPLDAVPFYETAVSLRNQPDPALYKELGDALHDAGEYAAAAEAFRKGLELLTPNVASWFDLSYRLAHELELAGDTDAAIETIEAAIEARPGNLGLLYERAWIAYHAKRWEDAIERFESLLAETDEADSVQAREVRRLSTFLLSSAYVSNDNFDAGAEVLERALQADPENVQANNDLGYLYADAGKKLDRALELIERAVAAEPENAAYLDSLGWVFFKLDRFEEAAEALEKAAALPGGEDAVIFDHLGQSLQQLGRTDDAVAAYREALRLACDSQSSEDDLLESLKTRLAELTGQPATDFGCPGEASDDVADERAGEESDNESDDKSEAEMNEPTTD